MAMIAWLNCWMAKLLNGWFSVQVNWYLRNHITSKSNMQLSPRFKDILPTVVNLILYVVISLIYIYNPYKSISTLFCYIFIYPKLSICTAMTLLFVHYKSDFIHLIAFPYFRIWADKFNSFKPRGERQKPGISQVRVVSIMPRK